MAMFRTHKSKIYPTIEQEAVFSQFAGVCRFIYNLALEQRRDWHRQHMTVMGRHVSRSGQDRELTQLRAEVDWIAAVPRCCTSLALADLDKAYDDFFKGRSSYPTPRRKGVNDSFRISGRDCVLRDTGAPRFSEIRLPKIGWVRFRVSRTLPDGYSLREVTIKREPDGWHLCAAIKQPEPAMMERNPSTIGIDRGVSTTLAFSDGTFASQPVEALSRLERRAGGHQQSLARQVKGSARRAATRALLAKTRAKIARVRKHWNHVQTSRLAKAHGAIVIEALKIRGMVKSAKGTVDDPGTNVAAKAGLNRSILNHNWGQFTEILTYKCEAAGVELIKINPAYTSQRCYACGHISTDNRKSQAVFECTDCGHSAHADTNAAKNIHLVGTQPAQRGLSPPLKREFPGINTLGAVKTQESAMISTTTQGGGSDGR